MCDGDLCNDCPHFYARPGTCGDEEPPEARCHAVGRCPEVEPDDDDLDEARLSHH